MAEQRLPIVDGDDGEWGDIINQFIEKEHYNTGSDNAVNGGHKTITIRPGTASAGTAPLKFSSGTILSTPEAGAMEFNNDTLYFTVTTSTTRRTVATYDDSSGANGDLHYRNSGGSLVRLGIGSSNQVLKVSGSTPAWGDLTLATSTKTSNYTVTTSDTVILADATSGTIAITLPTAASATGYRFFVKRIDNSGNSVTVNRSGSDTIDGATSHTISVQYTSLTLVSNGSNWFII